MKRCSLGLFVAILLAACQDTAQITQPEAVLLPRLALAQASGLGFVYAPVTDFFGDVRVISTTTHALVTTVSVEGNRPLGIAVSPDGSLAYVVMRSRGTVSVISTATNTVVATIFLGFFPRGIAITPDGAFLYVTTRFGAKGRPAVMVVETATNTVVETVPFPEAPYGVAITPDGAFAYVASGGTVSVIATATNKVVTTVAVDPRPGSVAFTPDGAFAYVASTVGNGSVISTATNKVVAALETIGGTAGLPGVVVSPDGAFAYVATRLSTTRGFVKVFSTATHAEVAAIEIGSGQPHAVAITSDGAFLYVTAAAWLEVIETATRQVVSRVFLGGCPGCAVSLAVTPQLSAEQQVDAIIESVQDLVASKVLPSGPANGLIAKLDGALRQLDKDNVGAAINVLEAFINQVQGLVNSGILTVTQGQRLIDAAQAVIDVLTA